MKTGVFLCGLGVLRGSFLGLGRCPVRRWASRALLFASAGCCTRPADARLRELLPPPRAPFRVQLEVEVESAGLRGLFDGVLIARPSPPAVRLQLLPDLGAPILDVVATPAHGDATVRVWRGAPTDPGPHPLLMFGITLLEQCAAVAPERVLCMSDGSTSRFTLRGCFPGVAIDDAHLVGGQLVGRTFTYGGARWRDDLVAGTVDAPGVAVRTRVVAIDVADDLDDAMFTIGAGAK